MGNSIYNFNLDIHSIQSQISLPVLLGDTARTLLINLRENGKPYIIADGTLAVLSANKPDDTSLFDSCVILNENTIKYDFTNQTASAAGLVDCQLRLYNLDGNVIASPRFAMVVDERVIYDDDVPISEDERTAIDDMLTAEAQRIANETARIAAESERAEAEDERIQAETARDAAETLRISAESARAAAETARATAETNRISAESARVSAEGARVSAESARASAETTRISSEAGRVDAESGRSEAEDIRILAESARVTAETARASAESTRSTNETTRNASEATRVSNELGRTSAESARVTAESARASAESGRVTAESARVTAEADRVSAESARVSAENSRKGVYIAYSANADGTNYSTTWQNGMLYIGIRNAHTAPTSKADFQWQRIKGNGITSVTATHTGNVQTITITQDDGTITTYDVIDSAVTSVNGKTGDIKDLLEIGGDYGDTNTIVGLAKNLESDEGITLSADAEETSGSVYADEPFSMRPTAIPFDDSVVTVTNGNETIKKVNGFTIVKNQLVSNGNFSTSSYWSTTRTSISGNVVTITETSGQQAIAQTISGDIPIGHKMMVICVVNPSVNCNISVGQDSNGFGRFPLVSSYPLTANTRNVITAIGERQTSPTNPGYARVVIGFPSADKLNVGDTLTFDFVQLIDLTKAFQSRPSIAAGLEGDSGCRWFLRNFPEYTGYVDFNLGVLKSVPSFTYKTTGINLWNEDWERGTYATSTGNKASSDVKIRNKKPIKVPTGATLYGYNNNVDYFTVLEYNANGKYIGFATIRNRAVQLDALCCYVNIILGSNAHPVTEYNNDTQLCLKWTETAREQAYHPHTEQEINIDWTFAGGEGKSVPGEISDYKDYALRKNHKRIASHTFTNSDTITRSATNTEGKWRFVYVPENAAIRPSNSTEIGAVLIDGFVAGSNYQTINSVDKTVSIGPTSGSISFYKEDLQTVEDMKAFLIGKTLYYALETEVVTDMDDSERNVIACDDYGLECIESESDVVPAGFTILYQDNLKRQITNNANAVGTLTANTGDLTALLTMDKTSLVNAINSLVARIDALEGNV